MTAFGRFEGPTEMRFPPQFMARSGRGSFFIRQTTQSFRVSGEKPPNRKHLRVIVFTLPLKYGVLDAPDAFAVVFPFRLHSQ